MHPKTKLFGFFLFAGLLFIGMGDNFLPQPLNNISSNTRSNINQFLMGLFPDEKPINIRERTERALDEIEGEEQ